MTTAHEDAVALDAIAILDGSGSRTRAGWITNSAQDDYSALVLEETNLVGYWKMDEASGTTLADAKGGAADDLTLVDEAATVNTDMSVGGEDYKGVQFEYDSGDSLAYAVASSSYMPSSYPFCLECAVKPNSVSTNQVLMRLSVNTAGDPYWSGGGDAYITKVELASNGRIAIFSATSNASSGTYSYNDLLPDGEVAHVFMRCESASLQHIYVNGCYIKDLGSYDVFAAGDTYGVLSVGGRYQTSLTGIPSVDGVVGHVALYDGDCEGHRIMAHAKALLKTYDIEAKGSATIVSAYAGSGGSALSSDGSVTDFGAIGLAPVPDETPQSAGSILDDLGRREQVWGDREPDYSITGQGGPYTIIMAVQRDEYDSDDVVIANNSSATHANTVNQGFWPHPHASAYYRDWDDGISVTIKADDTVEFQHCGITVSSTATLTNDDSTVIAARFDPTGGATYEFMSVFVNGTDRQDNTAIHPYTGSTGVTSSGVTAVMVAADLDAGGMAGKAGPFYFWAAALSDANIESISDKLLDEAGGGDPEEGGEEGDDVSQWRRAGRRNRLICMTRAHLDRLRG